MLLKAKPLDTLQRHQTFSRLLSNQCCLGLVNRSRHNQRVADCVFLLERHLLPRLLSQLSQVEKQNAVASLPETSIHCIDGSETQQILISDGIFNRYNPVSFK